MQITRLQKTVAACTAVAAYFALAAHFERTHVSRTPRGKHVEKIHGPHEWHERHGHAAVIYRPFADGIVIFEDSRPLPSPNASFTDVATLGYGRYTAASNHVAFSSTDGSDPRTSGRIYWAVLEPEPERATENK